MNHRVFRVLGALLVASSAALSAEVFNEVTIVPGEQATAIEGRVAELLESRLSGAIDVHLGADSTQGLTVLLGVPERHVLLAQSLRKHRIPSPTTRDPGGEGFVLKGVTVGGRPRILAAGVDERGLLYAVGELLRRVDLQAKGLAVPEGLYVRTAPAFEVRGLLVCQGWTMRELTKAREWTQEEWQQVVLDYALAGANTIEMGGSPAGTGAAFAFAKSYGLDTLIHSPVNAGSGPPEWKAVEAIGRTGYLCPSIPEARQSLLDACENRWKSSLPFDYARFVSGDGGGCECDTCAPYGAVYVRLVKDMAEIVHRHSPDTKIFMTNQKLDNAGDVAIFDYLRDEPHDWLAAFCLGPGSNAMGWMPGRRQDHRMDLFDHPAFGPWSRYPREILHQLPPAVDLVMFTDATHWVYSQYGLMDHELIPDRDHETPPHWGFWLYAQKPDPALARVYNRRTFHARPRSYYRVFQEAMPFSIGDVTYSEGHHDHANQWMWQRLLWAPHRSVEDTMGEYATLWFGPDAAEPMTEAIFQLEKNLSDPIETNDGIDRFYELVKDAGARMPSHCMETNYLWRQYMQKAALDKYIQLRYRRQLDQQRRIEATLARAIDGGDVAEAVKKAVTFLAEEIETQEMKALRAEAGRLGDESDALFGVRNTGYFNLDRDLVGFGWLKKELEEAASAAPAGQRAIVEQIVHYEDAGEGGYYDNAGDPERCPHLTYGWSYGDGGFADANRPSQRTMAFTTDEEQGVTFEYPDLDPEAHYRVRLSLTRPLFLPRFGGFQPQKSQSIYADDHCLEKDLELPPFVAQFFEYDIPRQATADGELKLWFQKSAGVGEGARPDVTVWRNTGGWGTLCSEVWLMKKR